MSIEERRVTKRFEVDFEKILLVMVNNLKILSSLKYFSLGSLNS